MGENQWVFTWFFLVLLNILQTISFPLYIMLALLLQKPVYPLRQSLSSNKGSISGGLYALLFMKKNISRLNCNYSLLIRRTEEYKHMPRFILFKIMYDFLFKSLNILGRALTFDSIMLQILAVADGRLNPCMNLKTLISNTD